LRGGRWRRERGDVGVREGHMVVPALAEKTKLAVSYWSFWEGNSGKVEKGKNWVRSSVADPESLRGMLLTYIFGRGKKQNCQPDSLVNKKKDLKREGKRHKKGKVLQRP